MEKLLLSAVSFPVLGYNLLTRPKSELKETQLNWLSNIEYSEHRCEKHSRKPASQPASGSDILPFCTYSIRWTCWRDKLINLPVQIKQSHEIQRINTTRTLHSRTSFQQTNVLPSTWRVIQKAHTFAAKQSTTGKFRVPFLRHWTEKS